MKCPSCNLAMINGFVCHEIGCPDKHMNVWDGTYRHRCNDCGFEVNSEHRSRFECLCNVDIEID